MVKGIIHYNMLGRCFDCLDNKDYCYQNPYPNKYHLDVLRMDAYCRKCGLKTNGLKCPRCEKRNQSFGV